MTDCSKCSSEDCQFNPTNQGWHQLDAKINRMVKEAIALHLGDGELSHENNGARWTEGDTKKLESMLSIKITELAQQFRRFPKSIVWKIYRDKMIQKRM